MADKPERKTYSVSKVDMGLITNLPSDQVVWSIGRNVHFKPGCLYKSFGKTLMATVSGSIPVRAMFTFRGYDDVFRTIVCCDSKIYAYTNNFGTSQDITPSPPPTSTSLDVWQFAIVGGMPIISNGVNPPWKWANFASIMAPLSNAPAICKALHVHENRIIVGNIQDGAYSFPARVKWCDIAKPERWADDLKGTGGRKDLLPSETTLDGIDDVQAITSIGKRLIVFSKRNIWYGTATPEIIDYSWSSLDRGVGLIAPRAFTKTPNGIYFMTADEIYLMGEDGSLKPLSFPVRNSIFPNLNKSKIATAFCYYKPSSKEVVFCYATGSNVLPDTAAIYSEETQSWTIDDVNYNCHSFYFDSLNMTWDTLPYGSWDSIQDTRWDLMGSTGILPDEIVANSTGQILKQDSGYNDNGQPIDAYIETGDMVLDNALINKIIYEIWPVLKPQDTLSALMVQVGTRENLHKDIDWSPPAPYTIGVSRNITVRKMGKYVRLRFFSNVVNSPWVLSGWFIKYDMGGSR